MRQVELPIYPVTYPSGFRLNQNESQFPVPERLHEQLSTLSFKDLHEYPVQPIDELFMRYAAYAGVEPTQLLVGCGSDEMIHVVTQALLSPEDVVLSPNPDFALYPIFTTIAHGRHVQTEDLSFDALVTSVELYAPKLLLLSNPNNPTGKLWSVDELTELAGLVPYLIVDEAYIDFTPESSMIPHLETLSNVIILRTLSKAFGLANVRLGFMITTTGLAHYFRQFVPPFNISGVSAKIANVFLQDPSYLDEVLAWHAEMREKWSALLGTIGHVHPAKANFLYVTLDEPEAVWSHLAKNGIHTSRQTNGIRVTLGDEQALLATKRALMTWSPVSYS
ncbi:histidinol-phosphate transaminase [Exiguobacterium sp.]|uniref:pyridoxal phosphate-dependent aminotransferase n=1 Tax=Exiguobacterium sp. TaxID=44751 RepID=UPI00263B8E08|nr:histidinol-phosphate transaminase [Exiguobacterium sp.]MCC5893532.1 histidinol-phosphate aminotransferase family protein [Exiguobacterium sp.]